jgi:hypothetical protein
VFITRRGTWLAVAAATVAIAGCGDDEESSEGGGGNGGGEPAEVVYSLPTPESLEFYAPIVAETLGFFEQENVSAELAPASEEIPSTAFLENGDADIAMADIDELIISTAEGGTLQAVFSPPTRQHGRNRRSRGQPDPELRGARGQDCRTCLRGGQRVAEDAAHRRRDEGGRRGKHHRRDRRRDDR